MDAKGPTAVVPLYDVMFYPSDTRCELPGVYSGVSSSAPNSVLQFPARSSITAPIWKASALLRSVTTF